MSAVAIISNNTEKNIHTEQIERYQEWLSCSIGLICHTFSFLFTTLRSDKGLIEEAAISAI